MTKKTKYKCAKCGKKTEQFHGPWVCRKCGSMERENTGEDPMQVVGEFWGGLFSGLSIILVFAIIIGGIIILIL